MIHCEVGAPGCEAGKLEAGECSAYSKKWNKAVTTASNELSIVSDRPSTEVGPLPGGNSKHNDAACNAHDVSPESNAERDPALLDVLLECSVKHETTAILVSHRVL